MAKTSDVLVAANGRPQAQQVVSDHDAERLAKAYLEGFNKRDLDTWTAIFDPNVTYRPSRAVSRGAMYTGHDGLRRFLQLLEEEIGYGGRLREVRRIGPDQFAILADAKIGEELLSPISILMRVRDGLIVDMTACLGEDHTLEALGLIPPP
jgi:ketosteroid isomerase-like protein